MCAKQSSQCETYNTGLSHCFLVVALPHERCDVMLSSAWRPSSPLPWQAAHSGRDTGGRQSLPHGGAGRRFERGPARHQPPAGTLPDPDSATRILLPLQTPLQEEGCPSVAQHHCAHRDSVHTRLWPFGLRAMKDNPVDHSNDTESWRCFSKNSYECGSHDNTRRSESKFVSAKK